ncbi:hypothetical protein [Hymenobacter sp. GOD-10R]|uniref:hypothetical protein n=1 Tax=Hymenobacter sp. GOD-10R TaxID=3093922 RepID=UPI002D79D8F3|nr:hypothetical protein [Hymenobacter sp. GOD-10R]WRQ29150.1 hypothetical protein SD425_02590 [Hymenobacter sp. GOD-10R]
MSTEHEEYEDYQDDEDYNSSNESNDEPDLDSLNNYWIWAREKAIERAEQEHLWEYRETGNTEFNAGESIPFHPDFQAAFLRSVGGSLSDPDTVPAFALSDWLQARFGRENERPTFQYLIDLLEEEYPSPNKRVLVALEWLKRKYDSCPSWPPRYDIERGFIIRRTSAAEAHPLQGNDLLSEQPTTPPAKIDDLTIEPAPATGPEAVQVLCQPGFTWQDALELMQYLSIVDNKGNCLTNESLGRGQKGKSAFTAAYKVLQRSGLFIPVKTNKIWAEIFYHAYGAVLGDKVINYKPNIADNGSYSFRDYVAEAKGWVDAWIRSHPKDQ